MDRQLLLILMRTTPYGGQQARAAIDVALTAAAFEQRVVCVLVDEGVLQVAAGQDTSTAEMKNIPAMLSAMEIYDVEALYLHTPSAQRYNLPLETVPAFCQPLDDNALAALVDSADQVMVF